MKPLTETYYRGTEVLNYDLLVEEAETNPELRTQLLRRDFPIPTQFYRPSRVALYTGRSFAELQARQETRIAAQAESVPDPLLSQFPFLTYDH
jgi:hypothetical protein